MSNDGLIALAPAESSEEEIIEAAFAPGALRIVHQPIVELSSGEPVGFEALARFSPPPARSPDKWFEAAGRVGRRIELERLAISLATSGLGDLRGGCFMSVNASPETVLDPAFVEQLERVEVARVVLEVTENARIGSYQRFADTLAPFRAQGLRLAVDDLGSGYASLNHILRLEPDVIKLDRSITLQIDRHRPTRALAAALTSFAMETGMLVVAEGIETTVQRSLLAALGISLGQGYLFGKPRPPDSPQQPTDASAWRQPQPALAPVELAARTRSASIASSRH
ncbi:MAG: EAL domain-containing protein [Solirubrobacteraceae bacterium]